MFARLMRSLFGGDGRAASQRRDAALELARQNFEAGKLAEAEAAIAMLMPAHANDAEVLHAAGLIAYRRGDAEAAIGHLARAAGLHPDDAGVLASYGEALRVAGRADAAEAALRKALELEPGDANGWLNLSHLMVQTGRRGNAIEAAERAVALRPAHAATHLQLGWCLLSKSQAAEALEHLKRACALDPESLEARFHAARAAAVACDWSWPLEQTIALVEYWAANPADPRTPGLRPFLAYEVPVGNVVRRAVAEHYSGQIVARATRGRPAAAPDPAPGGRLRVGYLSADFHNHPTMHLAGGLFGHHDRSAVEVFAYSFGEDDGSAHRRRAMQGVEHFSDVRNLAPREIAARIREDAIQVLVDLKGFTYLARPDILALRPAPVQASWLGYPGTMGSGLVDYLISDRIVTPPGSEQDYGESFALLPGSYQVNDRDQAIAPQRPSRAECGLPEAGLVLCCFNVLYKVDRSIFEAWMRILRALPGAVLWLLAKPEIAEANLRREAAARGIDPSRLVFARFAPREAHLARLANADLFLDTRLVNAHTGASDALRAGVPLLTCAGDSFPSRVAASLVYAAGIDELAVDSLQAYEELAIALGNDRERLGALRQRLHAGLGSCPLFDTARTARNLERAYALMWAIHQQGQGPAPFSVLEG